jgi:hypothetical protein
MKKRINIKMVPVPAIYITGASAIYISIGL